jgi:glycosyltransferase involved in cell wall biosynthesis
MKKNVLILMQTMGGGGAEKVLINILNVFDYQKYNIDLFLLVKTGVHLENIPKEVNLKYMFKGREFLKFKSRFLIKLYNLYFKVLLKIVMQFPKLIYYLKIRKNYDTEIAFLQLYTIHIVAQSPLKSKKIGWVHNDLTYSNHKYLFEEDFKKLDKIVFVSKEAEMGFLKKYPKLLILPRIVIYNMLNRLDILEKSNETINLLKKNQVLVCVGSLSRQKRFDRLLESLTILLNKDFKLDLWIIGSGSQQEILLNKSRDLEIQDNVFFMGYQKNPYKFIKNADIFVCSSDYEGFSLVVGEAMILSKPIVTTDCTGPKEILNYGEFGIITDKTAESLAEGVEKILRDKKLGQQLVDKSNKRIDIFDPNLILKKIENIL